MNLLFGTLWYIFHQRLADYAFYRGSLHAELELFLPHGLAGLFFAAAPAFAQEQEIVIVKYGTVLVKSPLPGAKVYIDDVYKGAAGVVIENVVTGKHAISCRREDKTVSGMFTVKKNEMLKLEARFDEGKIVDLSEAEKAGVGKKKKEEAKERRGKTQRAEEGRRRTADVIP